MLFAEEFVVDETTSIDTTVTTYQDQYPFAYGFQMAYCLNKQYNETYYGYLA